MAFGLTRRDDVASSSSGQAEMSALRIEIAASRLSTIRWVAGLLIAHAGVVIGTVFAMMTFIVNALK